METQVMNSFFQECLSLPWKPNSQDNPEHENQVEELLVKHGLKYVAQPNGIQNSPDFYVFHNGKQYSVECKSSKGHHPTYNGGLPKPGSIYIFSSKKYNKTTVYFADDVVKKSKRELFSCLIEEINDVLKKYQSLPEWQNDERGFNFYIRNMFTQSGGRAKTDYFEHKDKTICEESVLNAVY
tara:strand:+ start:93 stop:638 length:546 start_codon:yes stop_codon:yes gene_type:complete